MEQTEQDSGLAIKFEVIGLIDQVPTLKSLVSVLDSLITRYPDKEVENWAVITETLIEKLDEMEEDLEILRGRIYSQD